MTRASLLTSFLLCMPLLVHADIQKGNGVIVDSAATDYYNGNNKYTPSLQNDLSNHAGTQVQYIFPDVGYIIAEQSTDAVMSSATVNVMPELPCGATPTKISQIPPNTVLFFYTFCALPELQRPDPAVEGYTFPTPDLGGAYQLSDLIKYYSAYTVIPLITYDSGWSSTIKALNQAKNPNLDQGMQVLGQMLAESAVTDGAKGLAVDNELAINNTTSPTIEIDFFQAMTQVLAKNNATLFLYDANATALQLYKNYSNLVIFDPLYDMENASSDVYPSLGSPNAYYSVNQYQGPSTNKNVSPSVSDIVTDGMNFDMPIMFILPASATNTLWNSAQLYNSSGQTAQPCQALDLTPGNVELNTLSNFLCQTNGVCPTNKTGGNINTVQTYLGPGNCGAYLNPSALSTNHDAPMEQYFDSALAAIAPADKANPHYIGVTLYTWRVPHYADYACSSHYYSQNNPTSMHPCNQVIPSDIGEGIWQDFASWAQAK